MPFEIVRNDIVNMRVDAIVNTANPRPVIGSGTDSAIHAKAGPGLLKVREQIGKISVGCSEITAAFDLDAKFVIHTVGPVWRGGLFGEEKLLRRCYDSALALALQHNCRSIAFPLISSGNYGFPKDRALGIAIERFSDFLMEHEMQIYLVVFDRDSFRLSEKLFRGVASYIDEHYADIQYSGFAPRMSRPPERRAMEIREMEQAYAMPDCCAMPDSFSLERLLQQTDAGFTETLLKLIEKSGKKDSAIYKKANISKQHFSKIRSNPDYKPTKPTALAFAIALELDMEQTRDLIGRAGFALTRSSKFDLIVMYFIEHGIYDMFEINAALFEFDQNLLGGQV